MKKIKEGDLVKHRLSTLQIFRQEDDIYPKGLGLVTRLEDRYCFVLWENNKIEKLHIDYLLLE